MLSLDEIERALVITAHPDDVDFGAAGTIANLTDLGATVTYCIVTDGQAGGFDDSIPRPKMASTRREEQTEAASKVGVSDLVFLGWMDGEVESGLELRHDLSRVIRKYRPQVVLTQSPALNLRRIYASHPDHIAVAQSAIAAVYPDARNPYAFTDLITDGLEPWAVDEIWVMGHPEPDEFVEITPQIERKISALLCHESQHRDPSGMMDRVREWNAETAQVAGFGGDAFAEAFTVVDTR
ncbi:MAG TPA: PIG-L domain-containing protein [Acidimicrobiaceae bacterium]|nr:PIG-L domain-containing protein [Acidimicrobiaceae bacterium]